MNLFEVLKELSSVILPNKLSKIKAISGRHLKLYRSISKEEDLESLMLKTGWSKSYYYEVAAELKEKLLTSVLFAEFPKNTEVRRAWMRCHRQYAVFKVLVGLQIRKTAVEIGKKLLKELIEYEFTHLTYEVSRGLMDYYSGVGLDEKLFYKYRDLAKKYHQISFYEFEAQQSYHEVCMPSIHKKYYDSTLHPILKEKIERLQEIAPKIDSYRFHIYYYFLQVLEKELLGDDKGILNICDHALNFFAAKQKETPVATKSIFLNKKLIALFHLQRIDEAEKIIEKVLSIENKNSLNYAISLQFKVLWAFHSNNINVAIEILLGIQKENPVSGYLSQVWLILEAFTNFFIEVGAIEPVADLRRFRVGKFLNQVPTLEADKIGFNTTLIILQILFLLTKGDKGKAEIIEKAESLRGYLRNHFKENRENKRTELFIRILLEIPKNNFRRGSVNYRVKPLLKKLNDTPLNVAGQLNELEIVPYEKLWDLAFKLI